MIIILHPDANKNDQEYQRLMEHLAALPAVRPRTHVEVVAKQTLTEIYLIGDTSPLDSKEIEGFEIEQPLLETLTTKKRLVLTAPNCLG